MISRILAISKKVKEFIKFYDKNKKYLLLCLTGDTPVSPSPCSRTNFSLVRAVITYHNKNPPQGRVFIMVGPDGLEPTTRPL